MTAEQGKSVHERASHPALPQPSVEALAREAFCRELKSFVATTLTPLVSTRLDDKVRNPTDRLGQEQAVPGDRHEIAKILENDPFIEMWTAIRKESQELLVDGIAETVERELPRLMYESTVMKSDEVGGSLVLDSDLAPPSYITAVDIHCMPGGYYREFCRGDFAEGAMYDRLVSARSLGQLGALNDGKGWAVIEHYLRKALPDFAPGAILDMGCGVGHSTLPYVDTYPDADVYAIDIAAPMLRYAHARAVGLGKRVFFEQQNAECSKFESSSFDLIVSHILLHETSTTAVHNILVETLRLLRPGGIAIHADYPLYGDLPAVEQYMLDWDTLHNNEPFWGSFREMDLIAVARGAGFDRATLESVPIGRKLQFGATAGSKGSGRFLLLVLSKD